jgi:N-acetylornithine carbamoyltransferase
MKPRHFLSSLDWSSEELVALATQALEFKASGRGRLPGAPDLSGQLLGLLFFNPSVRTRLSSEAAMARLGGQATALAAGTQTWQFEDRPGVTMDGDTQEHVKELGPVLSEICDGIGIRKAEKMSGGSQAGVAGTSWEELSKDTFLHNLTEHAHVPVINLESNAFHPCQGLADMATLLELTGGKPQGKRYVLTWAWHPKALPVATPHSQLLAAADLGMQVTVARPDGYGLCPDVMLAASERAQAAGGNLSESGDPHGAMDDAIVVCGKSWGRLDAYGLPVDSASPSDDLRADWRVDEAKMARTANANFMHCLPIRRNVIATDGVLDSDRCAVVQQAGNRLWSAAAIFAKLLG